jgi:hypothetical protein
MSADREAADDVSCQTSLAIGLQGDDGEGAQARLVLGHE